MPKIAPIRRAYNVLADNILAYLHSFRCSCVRNVRNPEKLTENSNLWSSKSSKVINLGVNGQPICDFILVINSNFLCASVFTSVRPYVRPSLHKKFLADCAMGRAFGTVLRPSVCRL